MVSHSNGLKATLAIEINVLKLVGSHPAAKILTYQYSKEAY